MSREIVRLYPVEPRVETGPVQFGDDWPGVFFRGDDALFAAHTLEKIIEEKIRDNAPYTEVVNLKNIAEALKSCRVAPDTTEEEGE